MTVDFKPEDFETPPKAAPQPEQTQRTPLGWVNFYRDYGLQIIPHRNKIPALAWKEYQTNLMPAESVNRIYGAGGEFAASYDMGMVCGTASGNVFVIDLDTQKQGSQAQKWWDDLLEEFNGRLPLHTVEQRTGGGGLQKLFRAPQGFMVPTTASKNDLHVDIRGQAGFAVLPPSRHPTGTIYGWLADCAPDEVAIANAPQWLLDAIVDLVGAYQQPGEKRERTASPEAEFNEWGKRINGRDEFMADCVWGTIARWRKESGPIPPAESEWPARSWPAYENLYESACATRLQGFSVRDGLEKEGRGWSVWQKKWRSKIKNWNAPKMVAAAESPHPNESGGSQQQQQQSSAPPSPIEILNVDQILTLADPKWLVSGLMTEQALGFIYGPSGSFKSFIALDMALTFACSVKQWWGRKVDHEGIVVYVSCEAQADLKFRLRAWSQHRKVKLDNAPFYLVRENLNFMVGTDAQRLIDGVAAVATGKKVAAIFVDTVSRVIPGADENKQQDMTMFIKACDQLRAKFSASVVGLHHTNKINGVMRGSTVLNGAADFILSVERPVGAAGGVVTAIKVKAAQDGWSQAFKMTKVPMGDVGGNASLVADAATEAPAGTGLPDWDTCREILAEIDRQWSSGRPWTSKANTERSASKNIARKWRVKREQAEYLLGEWSNEGVIAEEPLPQKSRITGYRKLRNL